MKHKLVNYCSISQFVVDQFVSVFLKFWLTFFHKCIISVAQFVVLPKKLTFETTN